jgi:hypothetical protein
MFGHRLLKLQPVICRSNFYTYQHHFLTSSPDQPTLIIDGINDQSVGIDLTYRMNQRIRLQRKDGGKKENKGNEQGEKKTRRRKTVGIKVEGRADETMMTRVTKGENEVIVIVAAVAKSAPRAPRTLSHKGRRKISKTDGLRNL